MSYTSVLLQSIVSGVHHQPTSTDTTPSYMREGVYKKKKTSEAHQYSDGKTNDTNVCSGVRYDLSQYKYKMWTSSALPSNHTQLSERGHVIVDT